MCKLHVVPSLLLSRCPLCRYADAAKFRDMLAALDRQAKQAAALAAEAEAGADGKQVLLRLGQRVVHKEQGYRGVVVGWDVGCCESEEWQERAAAEQLKGGLRCAWFGGGASRVFALCSPL